MARVRNLKPGFFTNEDLAECTPWARLCFAGLWTIADREGRLEDRPKRIKAQLFAFDAIEVEPLLQELEARNFILRYQVDGVAYIQIGGFSKHQNPHHKEPCSVIPSPQSPGLSADGNEAKAQGKPEASTPTDEVEAPDKSEAQGSLLELSSTQNRAEPRTQNPEQGQKPRGQQAARRSSAGAVEIDTWLNSLPAGADPIPADDPILDYAEQTGIPVEYLELAWAAFSDAYRAKRKRQIDWPATFRNAVKGNWYKLWWFTPEGECKLTTAGEQARRAAA